MFMRRSSEDVDLKEYAYAVTRQTSRAGNMRVSLEVGIFAKMQGRDV
jgi:hypothetical protein